MEETLKLKWTRPESIGFPKTWYTFKARDTDSNELVEYRIQDIPDSRKEEVVQCMVKHFSKDEPLCDAYGMCSKRKKFEWELRAFRNCSLMCLII